MTLSVLLLGSDCSSWEG